MATDDSEQMVLSEPMRKNCPIHFVQHAWCTTCAKSHRWRIAQGARLQLIRAVSGEKLWSNQQQMRQTGEARFGPSSDMGGMNRLGGFGSCGPNKNKT